MINWSCSTELILFHFYRSGFYTVTTTGETGEIVKRIFFYLQLAWKVLILKTRAVIYSTILETVMAGRPSSLASEDLTEMKSAESQDLNIVLTMSEVVQTEEKFSCRTNCVSLTFTVHGNSNSGRISACMGWVGGWHRQKAAITKINTQW